MIIERSRLTPDGPIPCLRWLPITVAEAVGVGADQPQALQADIFRRPLLARQPVTVATRRARPAWSGGFAGSAWSGRPAWPCRSRRLAARGTVPDRPWRSARPRWLTAWRSWPDRSGWSSRSTRLPARRARPGRSAPPAVSAPPARSVLSAPPTRSAPPGGFAGAGPVGRADGPA